MKGPHSGLVELGDGAGALAARHLEFTFRSLLEPMTCESVEIRDGWVRAITGAAHPFGNLVVGLAPDALEDLETAVEPFLELEAPSMVVYPWPEVSDAVHERLGTLGFDQHDPMPAMAVDIAALAETTLPEGCEMRRVASEEEADEWIDALAVGYEIPREVAALFSPQPHLGSSSIACYAALRDGRMVATTTLVLGDGLAGIYCVSTLPEERGRGLGAHLTAEPLRSAARKGYGVGVLQASPMGHSVYRKLGFEDLGEVQMYVRMPS